MESKIRNMVPILPFETDEESGDTQALDQCILMGLEDKNLQPARRCSDEVFVRRVFLDVIGTLPTAKETEAFLKSEQPVKRSSLIEDLLTRDEFVDYWTLKWCDLLRVKAEFPINLWPNAVQAYHRWIYESVRSNKPYDQFAKELLTSSGSNFRVGEVNFYRAIQGRDPSSIASAVALTFMGCRFDQWKPVQRENLEGFFSHVAYKNTAEWKEEIVYMDPTRIQPLDLVLPDGTSVNIPVDKDPRKVFANWLIHPENPWFSRSIVNRQWAWLLGRGVVHEPDDFRDDNPPLYPEVLDCLTQELVKARYDLRQVFRIILNSNTYQQSSIPAGDPDQAERFFACYPVRRLDAEVLIDALHDLLGGFERYTSAIPEPFTFVPKEHRAIQLADGSITSSFLEMFGRPARDTGLESERDNRPTETQRLHLLNSSHVQQMLKSSPILRQLIRNHRRDWMALLNALYLRVLSRYPTSEEIQAATKYFQKGEMNHHERILDLVWALLNTKEFLYRH